MSRKTFEYKATNKNLTTQTNTILFFCLLRHNARSVQKNLENWDAQLCTKMVVTILNVGVAWRVVDIKIRLTHFNGNCGYLLG